MKKFILIALLSFFAGQIVSAQDTVTHDVRQLPQISQNFITEHFSDEKISYIKIDKELLTTDYEVTFVSGKEVEFDKNGTWREVDCKKAAVPAAIIPEKILQYVNQNYANSSIVKIGKEYRHYEVELANDLDLEFDLEGNFLRID
ncbi:MAG: PepSY-like domain-containing protein [Bacteroidales bacterium]|jgi:hypothetical protein|nr:PepSY-like domain-containing protein [Bacteroidales bacterium]